MRILITGCYGQVGTELMNMAASFGMAAVGKDRNNLDICDLEAVKRAVKSLRPDCIINAAAYTAVDAAELDGDRAYAINEGGAKHLALLCAEKNIPFLHISTDYVFDGKKQGRYSEQDSTNPLGVYAASKLAGDKAVRALCPKSIILRTSWVFSAHGVNFVKSMLRLGAERETLSIVSDQYGGPTPARDIARTLLTMLMRIPEMLEVERSPWGVYHYCGHSIVSWHQFAEEIFSQARDRGIELKLKTLLTIAAENYPTQAVRPANSALDCGKIKATFGIDPPDWREGLSGVMDAMEATRS